jgi:IrrE N-terminal-like domain
MATLERGFKSWCERVATAMRVELQLAPHAPLPAQRLAEHLGIEIITPHDIPDLPPDALRQLTTVDRFGWSAVSFAVDGITTVIKNPNNSAGRQSSDIMHELSHVILDHEPTQLILSEAADVAMRSFDAKQEDEANWLGWTMLLPRPALIHCAHRRLSPANIASEYEVSATLVAFRQRVTGVDLQTRRRHT